MISIIILHVLCLADVSYAQLKSLPPLEQQNQPSAINQESVKEPEIEEDPAIKELKSIFDDEELKNLSIPEKNNMPNKKSSKDEKEPQVNEEEPQTQENPVTEAPVTEDFSDPLFGDDFEIEDVPADSNSDVKTDVKSEDNSTKVDSKATNPNNANNNNENDDNGSKFEASFGDYNFSLFFPPQNFKNYLTVIEEVEREVFLNGDLNSRLSTAIDDIDEEILSEDTEEEIPLEQISLPNYYLISILYHTPSSWAVMINGITITSKNNDSKKELYVRAINPKRVELTWKPQEFRAFTKAIAQFEKLEEYKKDAHFKKILHRKTKTFGSYIKINEEDGTIDFALQPNQVFYMQYMNIYEGNPKDILPPPPPPPAQEQNTTTQDGNQTPTRNPDDLQRLLEQSTPKTAIEKLSPPPQPTQPNNNMNRTH